MGLAQNQGGETSVVTISTSRVIPGNDVAAQGDEEFRGQRIDMAKEEKKKAVTHGTISHDEEPEKTFGRGDLGYVGGRAQ